MLTEICNYVHNYFRVADHSGEFTISGGTIPFSLLDGQRFKITGSALNDGIYTYHSMGIRNDDDDENVALADETFTGTIMSMGIPRDFIRLATEITEWVSANSAALTSPYQSESFGGYSYTKASAGGSSGGVFGWKDQFRSRLNAYRKIS